LVFTLIPDIFPQNEPSWYFWRQLGMGITMRVLGQVCEDRENGFNFLRLLAASGILVAHCMLAVPVTNGSIAAVYAEFALAADLLLAVFFVFSGFLITASLERSQNLLRFAVARILRIFPALIVVSLCLVFILGPAVSNLPLLNYFADPNAWLYLPRSVILLDASASLPGVFEHHPVADAVNVPIWTLRYEVVIYALFPFLAMWFVNRGIRIKATALILGLLLLLAMKAWLHMGTEENGWLHLANFSASFLIGCVLWSFRHHVPHHFGLVVLFWLVFALSSGPVFTYFFGVVAAGYTFIWLAFVNLAPLKAYSRRADYSYGTYVIHFPVAQCLYGLVPDLHPLALTLLTFAVTLPLAAISWAWVEKPALARVQSYSRLLETVSQRWLKTGTPALVPTLRG
jgi:peptidoglycan/LPS O-acetylase OafA/YrhL